MKTYKIKLLTPVGVVTVNYTDNQDLTQFEQELKVKYNSFVTLSSNEIVTSGTTN